MTMGAATGVLIMAHQQSTSRVFVTVMMESGKAADDTPLIRSLVGEAMEILETTPTQEVHFRTVRPEMDFQGESCGFAAANILAFAKAQVDARSESIREWGATEYPLQHQQWLSKRALCFINNRWLSPFGRGANTAEAALRSCIQPTPPESFRKGAWERWVRPRNPAPADTGAEPPKPADPGAEPPKPEDPGAGPPKPADPGPEPQEEPPSPSYSPTYSPDSPEESAKAPSEERAPEPPTTAEVPPEERAPEPPTTAEAPPAARAPEPTTTTEGRTQPELDRSRRLFIGGRAFLTTETSVGSALPSSNSGTHLTYAPYCTDTHAHRAKSAS